MKASQRLQRYQQLPPANGNFWALDAEKLTMCVCRSSQLELNYSFERRRLNKKVFINNKFNWCLTLDMKDGGSNAGSSLRPLSVALHAFILGRFWLHTMSQTLLNCSNLSDTVIISCIFWHVYWSPPICVDGSRNKWPVHTSLASFPVAFGSLNYVHKEVQSAARSICLS